MGFKLTSHKDDILESLENQASRAMRIIGGMAEGYAKEYCPVDTGNLRNSITNNQEDAYTVVIGTNVEYAPYVELGTTRAREQPFLRPAIENHKHEFEKIVEMELK